MKKQFTDRLDGMKRKAEKAMRMIERCEPLSYEQTRAYKAWRKAERKLAKMGA